MLTVENVEARLKSIQEHLDNDNPEVAKLNEIALYQDVLMSITEPPDEGDLTESYNLRIALTREALKAIKLKKNV